MRKKKSQKQIDEEAFLKWFRRTEGYDFDAIRRYEYTGLAEVAFVAGARYERSRVKRGKKGRG